MAGRDASKDLTAAIIVIGDEILKGHVQDTNSNFFCRGLWELGVRVCKIVVLPDDLDVIAAEVRTLSPLHDFILTSGGVGPTHDDITMEAIGKAFSEDLCPHPKILRFLFPSDPSNPSHSSHPWYKMALVPRSTKVHIMDTNDKAAFSFLLMAVHNVHCYPGVPSLLKGLFQKCKDLYRGSSRFFLKEVFFSCSEDVLATPLRHLQRDYPAVQVGSYPDVSPVNNYLVRVALESKDVDLVEQAFAKLVLSLPVSVMMSSRSSYSHLNSTATERRELIMEAFSLSPPKASLLPDSLCSKIHDSLGFLEKALDKYSLTGLCVAFNGGKDCTVILALLKALLSQYKGVHDASWKITVLSVVEGEQFSEVEDFVQSTVKQFGLDMVQISGGIKEALAELRISRPELKAVCMGTRRTDPHSVGLEAFSVTDGSWPDYMRVNPILDWTYRDIWLFLKLCEIPYCSLYDQGYTSLDGMADTHPNPTLLIPPDSPSPNHTQHSHRYLPAYMLEDQDLERMGRNDKAAANL